MTIDMLAATFFWPEGTVLGAQGLPPEPAPEGPVSDDPSGADESAAPDGFWATVTRNLWRPSTGAVG